MTQVKLSRLPINAAQHSFTGPATRVTVQGPDLGPGCGHALSVSMVSLVSTNLAQPLGSCSDKGLHFWALGCLGQCYDLQPHVANISFTMDQVLGTTWQGKAYGS